MTERDCNADQIQKKTLLGPRPKPSKFRKGDIVCVSVYPGRDHWQQVSEITKVHPNHYEMRPIQSRTSQRDWSMTCTQSHGYHLRRGGWEEDQTDLFRGKTLEQIEKDKDSRLREIIREEIVKFHQTGGPFNVEINQPNWALTDCTNDDSRA